MKNGNGRGASWAQVLKRNAVVGAIVLFVCVAVYLNWNYQQGEDADAGKTLGDAALVGGETQDPLLGDTSTGDMSGTDQQTGDLQEGTGTAQTSNSYFAAARLNRQQARDSALALLQEASASESADQAAKDEANAAIQTMADYTVTEAQIENLVVAKGYTDCVAFISKTASVWWWRSPARSWPQRTRPRSWTSSRRPPGFLPPRSRSSRWSEILSL